MKQDPYGFKFWLGWILWFAGSFVLASIFWTALITFAFGKIQGHELSISWAVAVFGSWFILLTPFMRKKEQIWKRLNQDQEKAVDAWRLGMSCFIGILILSALFWSFWFREEITNPAHQGLSGNWLKAVLGTWLILLLPVLAYLYKKTDQILKAAIERQTQIGPKFKTQFVEKSKRILPDTLAKKLENIPETMPKAHVVNLILKSGRKIPDVFVLNRKEVLGIYGCDKVDFDILESSDVEPVSQLAEYNEEQWLRLDGRA